MSFKILDWYGVAERLGVSVFDFEVDQVKEAIGLHLETHPEITGDQVCAAMMATPEPHELSGGAHALKRLMREIEEERRPGWKHTCHISGECALGCCPECTERKLLQYVNIDRSHVGYCDDHRTRWDIGWNLFSSWRHEDDAIWRQNAEHVGPYRDVDRTVEGATAAGGDDEDMPF